MSRTARRRFPWTVYWLVLALIVLVAAAPLLSVIVASSVAEANGCVLHEGFSNPCLIGGSDWGDTLYAMGVMGWLMLATLPLGGGVMLVWLVILLIHYLAWRRSAKETMP